MHSKNKKHEWNCNYKTEQVKYNREGDAALDLRATDSWTINLDGEQKEIQQDMYTLAPNERILVKTGIILAIPQGRWGNIRDRSGLAFKQGLHCLGGVIDENYRGEIGVILINLSAKPAVINKNDRIAQIIIQPYTKTTITEVKEHNQTARGANGFGSSGK